MRQKITFILLLFFLGGCATFQGTGSNYWHKNRQKEIETAYQNKKITKAEYLSLKNEADKIREEYTKESRKYQSYYPGSYYGYYYPRHYSYRYAHRYGRYHYGRHHYGRYHGYYH